MGVTGAGIDGKIHEAYNVSHHNSIIWMVADVSQDKYDNVNKYIDISINANPIRNESKKYCNVILRYAITRRDEGNNNRRECLNQQH